MDKKICGIPAGKMINLFASLACVAVGMMFINLSLNNGILNSGRTLFIGGGFSYVQYSFIGFGFVFIVISVFFIYEAFRGGFFNPETAWKDGVRFCEAIILLLLILFCLDFVFPLFKIFLTVIL